MYATNYLETAILNTMKNITFSAPANLYVGLFLSSPGETGRAGTEVSYNGYSRKQIIFSEPAVANNTATIKNTEQITFTESPAIEGTASYIGILDSIVGGNMIAYGKLSEALDIGAGYAPVILVGEIEYYLSGDMSNAYKTKVLNTFRGISLTGFLPHFALFNGHPENGGAELSGDNYARVRLEMTAPAEAESGQAFIENSVAVNFNRPTTPWGNYSYSAIYNTSSSGEPVWIKEYAPAREIKKGYMPTIGVGEARVAIN